jgi:hypothetical protein
MDGRSEYGGVSLYANEFAFPVCFGACTKITVTVQDDDQDYEYDPEDLEDIADDGGAGPPPDVVSVGSEASATEPGSVNEDDDVVPLPVEVDKPSPASTVPGPPSPPADSSPRGPFFFQLEGPLGEWRTVRRSLKVRGLLGEPVGKEVLRIADNRNREMDEVLHNCHVRAHDYLAQKRQEAADFDLREAVAASLKDLERSAEGTLDILQEEVIDTMDPPMRAASDFLDAVVATIHSMEQNAGTVVETIETNTDILIDETKSFDPDQIGPAVSSNLTTLNNGANYFWTVARECPVHAREYTAQGEETLEVVVALAEEAMKWPCPDDLPDDDSYDGDATTLADTNVTGLEARRSRTDASDEYDRGACNPRTPVNRSGKRNGSIQALAMRLLRAPSKILSYRNRPSLADREVHEVSDGEQTGGFEVRDLGKLQPTDRELKRVRSLTRLHPPKFPSMRIKGGMKRTRSLDRSKHSQNGDDFSH